MCLIRRRQFVRINRSAELSIVNCIILRLCGKLSLQGLPNVLTQIDLKINIKLGMSTILIKAPQNFILPPVPFFEEIP